MKKNKGFTLIELLVVIAIIALLLSILLPSLKKAKAKVEDVVCRTRLRGLGLAINLYLEDNKGRAYNNQGTNGILWYDANGNFLRPGDTESYWGLAYKDYTEGDKVFACPSYKLRSIADFMYGDRGAYANVTPEQLKTASGYGLNTFFYLDPELKGVSSTSTQGRYKYNRKLTAIKTPGNFIVTHDHMEPRIEGNAHSADGTDHQDDMFYIPPDQPFNLAHYRTGARQPYYWAIFRHSKRNPALDDPAGLPERSLNVNKSPNGNANVLYLDGSVNPMKETTGENVRYSSYSGTKYY